MGKWLPLTCFFHSVCRANHAVAIRNPGQIDVDFCNLAEIFGNFPP